MSEVNQLNKNQISTVVRLDGFRLWGSRAAVSMTEPTSFINVFRIRNQIRETLIKNHLWAVDQGISGSYFETVANSVNAYFSTLKSQGAIMGGECKPDPDENTPGAIQSGKAFFTYEFTPTYPAERVVFKEQMTTRFAG